MKPETKAIYPDFEIFEEHVSPDDVRQKSKRGIYKIQITTQLRIERIDTWFFIPFYKRTEIHLDTDYMNALIMFMKSFHAEVYMYQFLGVVSSAVEDEILGKCIFKHDSDTRTEKERLRKIQKGML